VNPGKGYNRSKCVYNNIVVVFKSNSHSQDNAFVQGVGLLLQKPNRLYIYNNNRYRYIENTIINKGLLSLVGI
jgi:hypothetical protein